MISDHFIHLLNNGAIQPVPIRDYPIFTLSFPKQLVTMKLKKDMPNWVPMYTRKVRLEYLKLHSMSWENVPRVLCY